MSWREDSVIHYPVVPLGCRFLPESFCVGRSTAFQAAQGKAREKLIAGGGGGGGGGALSRPSPQRDPVTEALANPRTGPREVQGVPNMYKST